MSHGEILKRISRLRDSINKLQRYKNHSLASTRYKEWFAELQEMTALRDSYYDLPNEEWRTIDEFPAYKISNFARVKTSLGKIMSQSVKGELRVYFGVILVKGGKGYARYTHRLVAKAFVPNPNNLKEVNHIDCNKENNTPSNLEWTTRQDNMSHACKNGRIRKGDNHKDSKLTCEKVKLIREERKVNPKMTYQQLGDKYGVHNSQICRIFIGEIWKHVV